MTMSQSFAMTDQKNDPINDWHPLIEMAYVDPQLRNHTFFQKHICHDILSSGNSIPVTTNKKKHIRFPNLSHLLAGVLYLSAWVKKTCASNLNLANLGSSGITITGAESGYAAGSSVSNAGDVNGDGYADMLIGAPDNAYYYGAIGVGAAYLIYGGSDLANIDLLDNLGNSGITITGGNEIGYSVSGAGDVNGDGYADMLIGSPPSSYTIYLLYGGSNLADINLVDLGPDGGITIIGSAVDLNIGYSVSSAGDVNGDGYADMLIGSPSYSSSTGAAYLIYGGNDLASAINLAYLGSSGITITGVSGSSVSCYSVSGAGDVNGDGYADMLISAPDDSYSDIRIVYLIYGGSDLANIINLASLGSSGITITGAASTVYSVSGAGDVNGDGYTDMLIGAPDYYSSTIYLIYGGVDLASAINLADLGNRGITITGTNYSDSGYSVSGAGDVNRDGYADMLIGAFAYNASRGAAYLIYGSNNLTNINLADLGNSGITITNTAGYDTGISVSGSGDVNSDGYADMLIGAPYNNVSRGAAYLIYGAHPLEQPSGQPTVQPTINPSRQPSDQPSNQPSLQPITYPSGQPTATPSTHPSEQPTIIPSTHPSEQPTIIPSMHPSEQPTNYPTSIPSGQPTGNPSTQPSGQPTIIPTTYPSEQPTIIPTIYPSGQPTVEPSNPSAHPTRNPTVIPSGQPTTQPSEPSGQPTSTPSVYPSEHSLEQSMNSFSQPNTLYIAAPIISFFVGMPLILGMIYYFNRIFKNKAANLDIENQSTTDKNDIEMVEFIRPQEKLSSDKV